MVLLSTNQQRVVDKIVETTQPKELINVKSTKYDTYYKFRIQKLNGRDIKNITKLGYTISYICSAFNDNYDIDFIVRVEKQLEKEQ